MNYCLERINQESLFKIRVNSVQPTVRNIGKFRTDLMCFLQVVLTDMGRIGMYEKKPLSDDGMVSLGWSDEKKAAGMLSKIPLNKFAG